MSIKSLYAALKSGIGVIGFTLLMVCGAVQGQAQRTIGREATDSVALRQLQDYMWRYPQSQLRDVYKFCFQDVFGVEHLLKDSTGALRYLEREIAESDPADWQQARFVYPLTLTGDYVRVDIGYVRDGVIAPEVMVAAMLQSARREEVATGSDLKQWQRRWESLLQLLETMHPRPLNFDEDREAIAAVLASGRYAMHHSVLFNRTYRQHYRIVRRDGFEALLVPLIEAARIK